jgi:hypothetical protein
MHLLATENHNHRIITSGELLTLRAFIPKDKELTASLKFDPAGRIHVIEMGFGQTCTNGSCRAQFCAPGVCLHSHPFSNRISSADAAVCMHRSVSASESCSLVLAPIGVFAYRSMPGFVAKWRVMTAEEKRAAQLEWQFIGLALQNATQRGDVDDFITKMARKGIQISYASWKTVEQGGVLAL